MNGLCYTDLKADTCAYHMDRKSELEFNFIVFTPTITLIFVNINFPHLKDCQIHLFQQIIIPIIIDIYTDS